MHGARERSIKKQGRLNASRRLAGTESPARILADSNHALIGAAATILIAVLLPVANHSRRQVKHSTTSSFNILHCTSCYDDNRTD